jgi:hypothetical protein
MSQLTNYIQKELHRGFSKKLVMDKLVQAGYNKKEIKESFKSLEKGEPLLKRKAVDHTHFDVHVQWSKWVFPLLALMVALFLGYLVFLYATGDVSVGDIVEKEVDVSVCDGIDDDQERDLCLLEIAADGGDVCSLITSDIYQQLCETDVWESEPCLYLHFQGGDREQCLWDNAIATGDVAFCHRMVHNDEQCLFEIALATEDPSICSHEDECYKMYAVATEDKDICELIDGRIGREICYNYYDDGGLVDIVDEQN